METRLKVGLLTIALIVLDMLIMRAE